MLVPSLVFRRLQADDVSIPFAGHSKYVRVTMRYLRCCGTVVGSSRSNSSRIRKSRVPSNNLWFAISSSHRHHWTDTTKSHNDEVHREEEIRKTLCFHFTIHSITYRKICVLLWWRIKKSSKLWHILVSQFGTNVTEMEQENKGHPTTCHEGRDWEKRYRSTWNKVKCQLDATR